jgi:hypothetical protein
VPAQTGIRAVIWLAAERGYCLRGRVTMRYSDGDTEFVEFTRADQTPGINTLEL